MIINLEVNGINSCTLCQVGGICTCKHNVETTSGTCNSCITNHYGFERADGCVPCGCNHDGVRDSSNLSCNVISGQCDCQQNVLGKLIKLVVCSCFVRRNLTRGRLHVLGDVISCLLIFYIHILTIKMHNSLRISYNMT